MENKIPQWEISYKEVKNFMHNELGITREEMKDIITKIVREEVAETVGGNGEFIRYAMKEIIRQEMIFAINGEEYPRVRRGIWDYTKESKSPFSTFISDILKQEIIELFRGQFDVGIDIQPK